MQHERGAGGKGETREQSTRRESFNDLQNMLFRVSSLAQVAKKQMTMLSRFGVHICITFWVEVNVNIVYMSQATFRGGCCIRSTLHLKNVPSLVIFVPPLLRNPGDGPDCCKRYYDKLSEI